MNFNECVNDLLKIFYNERRAPKNDPLISHKASTVREFYREYPYVIMWGPSKSAWYYTQIDEAGEWCKENCVGKFTWHIHRVISRPEFPNVKENDWQFNDIAGFDHCFWAFTNEKDALLFSLKW